MVNTMATGSTPIYDLPYPLVADQVNVHQDMQALAEQTELVLLSINAQTIDVINTSGGSIAKGDPVYVTGYTTKPTVSKSVAETFATFPVLGLAQAAIANSASGLVVISGTLDSINTNAYEAGNVLYVATGGGLTATKPATGSGAVAVVTKKNASTGILIVGQPKGNGTWGSLKAGLA